MKENTYTLWKYLLRPVSHFFAGKYAATLLLLLATLLALVWANSPYSESYSQLWNTHIVIGFGEFQAVDTLGHFINDGLMVIFFFVVGLEIKREFLVGELSSPQKAVLPIVAALGGMLAPALFYAVINQGGPGTHGWGIPMATDIAFSLGCLLALGKRVPLALKVFLLALAIVDDIGAILVIALFYTEEINIISMMVGGFIIFLSVVLNRSGVRKTFPYGLLGIALWIAFLQSGIHATVAGVLLALTIPARVKYDQDRFKNESQDILANFPENDFCIMMVDQSQKNMISHLKAAIDNIDTPLQKLEDALYPLATYFVIPLFALSNAGIEIAVGADSLNLFTPVTLGVIIGLMLGKPLGILLCSWLVVKTGFAVLPEEVSWMQLLGVSCLAGIGFTMSLFIANLAFADAILLQQTKIGVLIGSSLSAVLGVVILWIGGRNIPHREPSS